MLHTVNINVAVGKTAEIILRMSCYTGINFFRVVSLNSRNGLKFTTRHGASKKRVGKKKEINIHLHIL